MQSPGRYYDGLAEFREILSKYFCTFTAFDSHLRPKRDDKWSVAFLSRFNGFLYKSFHREVSHSASNLALINLNISEF